jgi:ligand-binding SRPBCC domain-containing protein
MPRIELTREIAAPVSRCFDLARSVQAHLHSTSRTGERVVHGSSDGLLEFGDQVTWEARHLGIRQTFTSRITEYERPRHFRDVMIQGAFRRFAHDHYFESTARGTMLRDVVDYEAPLGILGRLAESLFLTRYLRRFLVSRNEALQDLAQSDRWREFVPGT